MLPDRYGNDKAANQEDEVIVSDNLLTFVSLVFGICGLALMAEAVLLKRDSLYSFAFFALQLTGQPQYLELACWVIVVAGLATFVVSMYGGWVSLRNKRLQMKIFLFLILILALIVLAAGVIILVFLGAINSAIYNSSGTSSSATSLQGQVIHFQLSMFNNCCFGQGFNNSKEMDVRQCSQEVINTNDPTDITTCFKDYVVYYQYNAVVSENKTRNFICPLLGNATVDVTGVLIPGTSVEVTAYTKQVTRVPIVGNVSSPIFGCGMGYAKAFQAAQFLWMEQKCKPMAITAVVCASVELIGLSLGLVAIFLGAEVGDSMGGASDNAYDKYLKQFQTDRFAESANATRASIDARNRPADNRMSVNLPVAHAIPVGFNVDDKI